MFGKIIAGVVIIALITVIGFFISSLEVPKEIEDDETKEEYIDLAKSWIRENVKTFTERGGSDLEYVRAVEVEEDIYEVTFDFNSAFAGYGPKTEEEMAAQVITEHTVIVTLEDGEVTSAITDGRYDEINEKFLEEEEEDMVTVNLYFAIVEEGLEDVRSVERELSASQDIEEYTLQELLAGPSQEEEEDGYFTAINEETTLLSFYIEEEIAYPDFSSELDASGSATVSMIRNQIENTLLQFDAIDDVEISIEGETEDILQP